MQLQTFHNANEYSYADLVVVIQLQTFHILNADEYSWTDLVVTMQLQNQNTSIKIAYMTTETDLNKRSCFLVNGDSPIQTVLPDLTDFQVSVYHRKKKS
jgi:hypothetical protein